MVISAGLCNKHYTRQRRGQSLEEKSRFEKTLREKFDEMVDRSGECWEWTGCKNGGGYGHIRDGSKMIGAHRLSYKLHIGPIPSGLKILHKCDNPSCVNPDHLFLGTQKDNMADMVAKGRSHHPHGEISSLSKLTEEQVLEIRSLYPDVSQASLASTFEVFQGTICKIVNRKTWRHI